jgi:hypothetical protein
MAPHQAMGFLVAAEAVAVEAQQAAATQTLMVQVMAVMVAYGFQTTRHPQDGPTREPSVTL